MKYILLLMAIVCFSCSAKHNGAAIDELETKASITIDLSAYLKGNKNEEIMLSKLVDSLEYVPLNTPHDLPVDILISVKISSDNIFVLDRQQNLFRFDRKGNFLNLIGGRGEGDKEYISVVNFEVDEQAGRVHLFDIYRKKIKTYDLAGNYHGEVSVPSGIENVALLNDSNFIGYKPWYSVEGKMNQCVILDKQGREIKKISISRKQTDKEVEINLFRMPDFNHILNTSRFCLPFDNTIYLYAGNDKVTKDVQFELGKYLLPLESSMNVELYNQSLNSPYVFELNSCRMDNMVYISFFYQKNSYRVVYDIIKKTIYTAFVGSNPQGVTNDLDNGANFWPLWFESGKMIGVMSTDMLDMEYEDVRVKDLYERLKKCDNPVLQIGYLFK